MKLTGLLMRIRGRDARQSRGLLQYAGRENKRAMRTRFFTFIIGALILAPALSAVAAAQEKDKETKKPASTVDAWRRALPPEAETGNVAEELAPGASSRPSRDETERTLIALERKWMEAVRLRDASALGQIVADDFTLVSPRLAVAAGERGKYFEHALRDLELASYDLDQLTVRLYGRAAVVSGRLKQAATAAGEDWGGTYLITDVWVSRDGFWRVVSRHASLSPSKR